MPKEKIILISANNNTLVHMVHEPIKMEGIVIVSTEPVAIRCPQTEVMDGIINKGDTLMRIYDFDRAHLESKKHENDRRERLRFQNIYTRVQTKQIKQLNIKKQKGR